MTDQTTLSTNSEVSEHGNEDFVNPSNGGTSYGVSGPDKADSYAMCLDHQARMGCGARDC